MPHYVLGVRCSHQRIIPSESSTGQFSTRVIFCVTLKYFTLFSSFHLLFLFLPQSVFDRGCLPEFLTAARPVAALSSAHWCSLHTNILPSMSSCAAKFSSASRSFYRQHNLQQHAVTWPACVCASCWAHWPDEDVRVEGEKFTVFSPGVPSPGDNLWQDSDSDLSCVSF